jgi:hypothetical protein
MVFAAISSNTRLKAFNMDAVLSFLDAGIERRDSADSMPAEGSSAIENKSSSSK